MILKSSQDGVLRLWVPKPLLSCSLQPLLLVSSAMGFRSRWNSFFFFFFPFIYLTAIMWSSSSLSSRLNKIIWSNFSIWHYDSSQRVCYICPNLLHIPLLLCPKFCSFILFFINANFMGFVCTSTQHHFSCLGITMSNPWIPSYRTVHKPVKFCSCTVY